MRRSQGLLVCVRRRGWRTVDGNSCPDHGESPCKFWDSGCRPARWTHSWSSRALRRSDVRCRAFWQHSVAFLLFGSVCSPTDGKQAGSMFSGGPWGSGGPEGGDAAKVLCRPGMTMATPGCSCSRRMRLRSATTSTCSPHCGPSTLSGLADEFRHGSVVPNQIWLLCSH